MFRAPARPAYLISFALSLRYLSIARRMSSATGAPVFSDKACSFLTCSGLRNRAVRFINIRYSIGIQMSIGVLVATKVCNTVFLNWSERGAGVGVKVGGAGNGDGLKLHARFMHSS